MGMFDFFKKKSKTDNQEQGEEYTAGGINKTEKIEEDVAEGVTPEEADTELEEPVVTPEESDIELEEPVVTPEEVDTESEESAKEECSFFLGVLEVFPEEPGEDLVLGGSLRGTVKNGMEVLLSHFGSDEKTELKGTVKAVITQENPQAGIATNVQVILKIANLKSAGVRPGFVVYTEDVSLQDLHNAYIATLGDVFVSRKALELTEEEMDSLSITDCAEIQRLFTWFHGKSLQGGSDEVKASLSAKLTRLGKAMATKILEAPSVFCVYSNMTGKPYLFSRVVNREEGQFFCTPPNIMIFTKAYYDVMAPRFENERLTVKEILNDANKKEIARFLRECFYLNGAIGVNVLSEQSGIPAAVLVDNPYGDGSKDAAKAANPAVNRYCLLLAQIAKPSGQEEEDIYKLYYRFLTLEMKKARFLLPVKNAGLTPVTDASGKLSLRRNSGVELPLTKGRNERMALRMYTDRRRMGDAYNDKWDIKLLPLSAVTEEFDVVLNASNEPKGSLYISKEMFEDMKRYE